jgi:hypothetical protein
VAPTSADLLDAQLEVDESDIVGGTLAAPACTAGASLGGVFACTGVALSEGYICAADGALPVGSLTVGDSAAYTCAGVGVVSAAFTAPGVNYAAATQPSPADMAFVNAFAPPVGVVAPSDALYPGDGAPQPGSCYVVTAAGSVAVTCYGYAPAVGYGCASSSRAAPTLCAAGQFSNASSQLACADCGPSSYSAAPGAAGCATCPSGSGSSTTTGNNALSTCLVSAGFFISGVPDTSTVVPCAADSYCPGGGGVGAASTQGAGIVACPAGSSALPGASAAAQCTFPSPPPPPGGVIMTDLLSASSNASAMGAALTSQLASMSPDEASQAQAALLTQLSSMNTTGNGEAAASLVLAVVSAAPGVVLSLESQNAALNVLLSVASGPINVTGGAAQSITGALSAVASSASLTNPAALAAVAGVLDNLASSQASSLVAAMSALPPGAPPPAAATTSSPTIQTLVQIDPPGGSRLTTQPLTAPGSPSAFSPMPADLLPTDTAVVTSFFSLAFDPNGGANTTGLTRLAFSNADGSPIPVENAEAPILFTLPSVDTSSGNDQAVCSFWDTVALKYSSQGCAQVPSPGPPGHQLFFVPGFRTTNDSYLAMVGRK